MTKQTINGTATKHHAKLSGRFRIAKLGDGFHIREVPAGDGAPVKVWPGPFRTRRGAEMFLEVVSEEDGAAEFYDGAMTDPVVRQYEREARLREFFEQQEGVSDPRGLARELADSPEILFDDPEYEE